jgi:cation:H+ antiporter
LQADRADIRPDVFAMLGSFVLLAAVAQLGQIGRLAGLVMIAMLAAYLLRSYLRERAAVAGRRSEALLRAAEPPAPACEIALDQLTDARGDQARIAEALEVCEDWRVEEVAEVHVVSRLWLSVVFVIVGLAGLVVGADLLVKGASDIAASFGLSAAVVGLTVVAVGTSLPELTTSVVATLHDHPDVAIGNVLGSNVFNVLAILGLTALVAPLSVASRIARVDIPVMMLAGVAASALLLWRGRIGRVWGAVLFGGYVAYIVFLYAG